MQKLLVAQKWAETFKPIVIFSFLLFSQVNLS